MERITFEGNFCDIAQCTALPCPYDNNCDQKKVWERLKEYEDTGLSPTACAEAMEAERHLATCNWTTARLVDLWRADQDGRLVNLDDAPDFDESLIFKLFTCADQDSCNDCVYFKECLGPSDTMDEAAVQLERLMHMNKHLREATKMIPRWRPVSEPPKESATVLTRDIAGMVTTAYYNGRWHGMLNCDAITHWMPLPEPPSTEDSPAGQKG